MYGEKMIWGLIEQLAWGKAIIIETNLKHY
jgi:hypothetical protein